MLDVTPRSLRADGLFIPAHDDAVVFAEEAIDIFESAVGGLRVEEVDYGDEGGVEDSPDDVEFPVEGLDTDGGDFDDWSEEEERG